MQEATQHLKRIQQIDQIAKETLVKYEQKLPQKYANIQTTLKLLNNLITSFRKRAQNYQHQLKSRAKINDLGEQIEFHRARINECERMSAALTAKVQLKRGSIAAQEARVMELRKQLLQLKTENVKKILKLQNLEEKRKQQRNKENLDTRKATWRMKTQISRGHHINLIPTQDSLILDKLSVTKKLCSALRKKMQTQEFIQQAWSIAKNKLLRHEKKASSNGLHGSLMFKMLENEHPASGKPFNDSKLIIYDVLKAKYKNFKKQQQNKHQVSEQEFMEYSPMQILGIIQLHGGISKLTQAINLYEKELSEAKLFSFTTKVE